MWLWLSDFIWTVWSNPKARKEFLGIVQWVTAIVLGGLLIFAVICVVAIISYYWH
jgi:hypothetical protein